MAVAERKAKGRLGCPVSHPEHGDTPEHRKPPDEARRPLRALYTTEADLLPDPEAGTLSVRLHHGANAATDQAIEKLCEELNAAETVFPHTNLRLVLKLGST